MREERGSSSAELASALGVQETYVQELEAGARDPDYELLFALAPALGVRPAALIGRAEELAQADRPFNGRADGLCIAIVIQSPREEKLERPRNQRGSSRPTR